MRKPIKEILRELQKEERYFKPRNEILDHFSGYEIFSEAEKDAVIKWFLEYIHKVEWNRKYAYAFCHELFSNEEVSELLKDDFDGFYSDVIGNGITNERSIRFKGEPEDLSALDNYIGSGDWYNS